MLSIFNENNSTRTKVLAGVTASTGIGAIISYAFDIKESLKLRKEANGDFSEIPDMNINDPFSEESEKDK